MKIPFPKKKISNIPKDASFSFMKKGFFCEKSFLKISAFKKII